MNDLGDRPKRGVLERQLVHEDLERATMSLARELGLEHVEPNLAWRGAIAARRHELEPGRRVDKPSYQPGARDPVDVDPLARDPDASLVPAAVVAARLPGRSGGVRCPAAF